MHVLLFATASLLAAGLGVCPPDYNYRNPAEWPGLCRTGDRQSPIVLVRVEDPPLRPNYLVYRWNVGSSPRIAVTNGGFGPKITGSLGTVDTPHGTLTVQELHLHKPAEHFIGDVQWEAEAHFVLGPAGGAPRAVLAIGVGIGTKNHPTWQAIFDLMPSTVCSFRTRDLYVRGILSNVAFPRPVYAYDGSLTTPACGQGLRWYVLDQQMLISRDQMRQLGVLMNNQPTNRPTQPLHGREVDVASGFSIQSGRR